MFKISIITGTHNHESTLPLLYKSLMSQKVSPENEGAVAEWLICDDGSTDKTLSQINELCQKHEWIEGFWQNNRGMRLARSLNSAIHRAKGDLIFIVMGDSYLDDNTIDNLCNTYIPGSAGCGLRKNVHQSGEFKDWDWRLARNPELIGSTIEMSGVSTPWQALTGNSMIVPRDYLNVIGGWPEHYTGYGKDDWWVFMKLHAMGVPLVQYNAVVINHVYHGEGQPDNAVNTIMFEKELHGTKILN